MTEQNPDPQLDQLDGTDEASPAPSPADDAQVVNEGTGRFAVYDKVELRFRGRVHDTRKGANTHKSELAGKGDRGRFEVREV